MFSNKEILFQNELIGPYRYGFNGKEKDSEGMGGGQTTYDYGFRIYNPAIGRFLSVDPLTKGYPWYTPYQFAGNKPIWAVDLDGLEEFVITHWYDSNNNIYKSELTFVQEAEPLSGNYIHIIHNYEDESGGLVSRRTETSELRAVDFADETIGYENWDSNDEFEVRSSSTNAFSSDPNLYSEFKHDNGPENSVLFNDNVMVKDVQRLEEVSRNYCDALEKWAEDGILEPGESYTEGVGNFGWKGAVSVYWDDLYDGDGEYIYTTEHFIGSFAFNAWVLEDGKTVLFCISDSKTYESRTAHTNEGNSHCRGWGTGYGNTYQKYIWTEQIDLIDFEARSKNSKK